jgi:Tfp pilus assembly protein PilF
MPKYLNIFLFLIFLIFTSCSSSKDTSRSSNSGSEFDNFIRKVQDTLISDNNGDKSEIAQDHFIKGLNYYNNKDYANAIIEYQDALMYEKSPTVYLSLADAYIQVKNLYGALNAAINAYLLDNKNEKALDMIFSLFVYKGDIKSAEKVITEIYSRDTSFDNFLIMTDFYQVVDPAKAIRLYEKYLKTNQNEEVKINLVKAYLHNQDTIKAMNTLFSVVKNDPDSSNCFDLIETSIGFQKYSFLSDFLNQIYPLLSTDSKNKIFNKLIQELQSRRKQWFKNTDLLSKVLQKTQDNTNDNCVTNFFAADLSAIANDTNLTVHYINKSLENLDTLSEIPIYCANLLEIVGQKNQALEVLTKYQGKFPDNYKYITSIGFYYYLEGNFQKALAYFQEYTQKAPLDVEGFINLADCYDRLNNQKDAESNYLKAIKLEPDNATANNNYAYYLSKYDDKLNDALTLSKKAIDKESTNAAFIDTYGWILFKLGKYEESQKYLEKAINLDSTKYDIYEHLGDLYVKLGLTQKAKDSYQKALELDPDNKDLKSKYQEIESTLNIKKD